MISTEITAAIIEGPLTNQMHLISPNNQSDACKVSER